MYRNSNIKKIATLSLFLSLSLVLSYLETLIPTFFPGVKLGLANTLGLIVLALYSKKDYALVSILRVVLMGLIIVGFSSSFLISLSGMIISIIFVIYFKFVFNLSIYGLSIISAIFHGVGQILMVALLYSEIAMITYLPVLLFAGVISGFLIAFISKKVITILINSNIQVSNL